MRPAKPVAPTPPTRFADADLSTWCQRYEGEPDEGVVRATRWGNHVIMQSGMNPQNRAFDEPGRSAVNGVFSDIGWALWEVAPSGETVRTSVVQTEAQATAWVRDGVLP